MLFVGFFGVSMLNPEDSATSLILLYILYGFLCGSGVGMGYNAIISTVNKSFADRAGLASGVMLLGFGLGGIVLGGTVGSVIEKIGLFPTFRILGILIAVVLFVGSIFITPPPVEPGKTVEQKKPDDFGYTASEMIRGKILLDIRCMDHSVEFCQPSGNQQCGNDCSFLWYSCCFGAHRFSV